MHSAKLNSLFPHRVSRRVASLVKGRGTTAGGGGILYMESPSLLRRCYPTLAVPKIFCGITP